MVPSFDAVSSWLRRWLPWGGLALVTGFAGVAGSFAAVGRTPAFVVAPIDGLVVQYTPGVVLRYAITVLGDLGHQLAFVLAIVLAGAILALPSLPGVLALRNGQRAFGAFLAAALTGLVTAVLAGATVSGAGAALGAGLVVTVAGLLPGDGTRVPVSGVRRQVLGAVATVGAIGLVGGLRHHAAGARNPADEVVTAPDDAREGVAEQLDAATEQSLDVDGLEPLVSTSFYEVDINNVNPQVDPGTWSVAVTGAVEDEISVDLADLRAMPTEDRFVSLRCVGDDRNGRKLDNALWTGVPMEHILDRANPQGQYVMLRAADDYYNEFPIAALWPGLLAYGMNGRDLPRGHGAPARALVPGHWGEINVKWLTEIEVLDREAKGYWEKRGWHGTGPVHTVAKLWVTNRLPDGRIEVAGHAYAGTRGIARVEVSTDGGETWTDADLSEPLPGDDVWRQWVHRYRSTRKHRTVVRAVDDAGIVQKAERVGAYPNGATGWVSKTIPP
jgi:DMSO/TMAO reductase YedYZ molybdopterin-dependent catalytic subunit